MIAVQSMIALACPAQKPSRCAAEPKSLTQEIHRETNSLGLWRKVESVQGPLLLVEGSHVCAVRCCGDVRSADEGSQSAGGQPSTTKQTKKPARKGGLFCLPGRMEAGIEAAGRGAAAEIRRACLAAAGARRAGRFPQPRARGGPAARASCAAGIRRPCLSLSFPSKVFLR